MNVHSSVERGLKAEGLLPGRLKTKRRAKDLFQKYHETKNFDALIFAATLAVSEENAAGGKIVTAPTCGASGVLPGVLYAYHYEKKFSLEEIYRSILVGGLIGNLVKHNASISGAEVGCQGEVGTACSMTAACLAFLKGGTNLQIEYAAEIGLEHHLGMTCDPVGGYVQIPCIERNAISAKRAIDSCSYALLTDGNHYITFDSVVESMNETGKDIDQKYRETSLGGLAKRLIEDE
jgi:L-serine dehydratase